MLNFHLLLFHGIGRGMRSFHHLPPYLSAYYCEKKDKNSTFFHGERLADADLLLGFRYLKKNFYTHDKYHVELLVNITPLVGVRNSRILFLYSEHFIRREYVQCLSKPSMFYLPLS